MVWEYIKKDKIVFFFQLLIDYIRPTIYKRLHSFKVYYT